MLRISFVTLALMIPFTGLACRRVTPAPVPAPPVAADAGVRRISFADSVVGSLPPGTIVRSHGPGRPADWRVVAADGSKVLAQLDADDTNHRYNLLLWDGVAADVRVEAEACAISGERDRSFGVVARAQDDHSYLLVRCNTSGWGPNVRIYRFVQGVRSELAQWDCDQVKPGEWHRIGIEVVGTKVRALFDGLVVAEADAGPLTAAGRCGVWTKAESVSQFRSLLIAPAGPPTASGSAP